MEVPSLEDRLVTLSIRRLADEFGMARETVTKRLTEAGVKPASSRNGHAVYRLRDAAPALLDIRPMDEDGRPDPSKMKPAERRAWFQSENERLKFEQDLGLLILGTEVQSEMATLAKIVVRVLETLPDSAERDLRCGPEFISYLRRKIRALRVEIAEHVRNEDATDARASA